MKLIIVGAGITGLSLAIALAQKKHQVLVLESAPQLAEIGAGIQMTPQAVKHLFRWGLKEDILEKSIVYQSLWIKDGCSGKTIGRVPMSEMDNDYGAPYIVVHRAALHDVLHQHALKAGAEIQVNSKVVQYDFADGTVSLSNGQLMKADLIVACDGINSFARSQLLKELDPGTQPTGWAAFRMTAEVSKIKADPLTADVVNLDTCDSVFWCAPDVSCMTYLVKGGTVLNMVLSHRDQIDTSSYTPEEYMKTVKNMFQHFEPSLRRLLDISAPTIVNYPVYATPPLAHWTHDSGHFTLAGDAAHAMAFYLSMGVSLAVEDAVGLCTAIDLATGQDQVLDRAKLGASLRVFEHVRKRRAEAVQNASLHAGNVIHMPAGEGRVKLYQSIAHADTNTYWHSPEQNGHQTTEAEFDGRKENAYGISDKETRDWCYGYDAEADIRNEWNKRAQ